MKNVKSNLDIEYYMNAFHEVLSGEDEYDDKACEIQLLCDEAAGKSTITDEEYDDFKRLCADSIEKLVKESELISQFSKRPKSKKKTNASKLTKGRRKELKDKMIELALQGKTTTEISEVLNLKYHTVIYYLGENEEVRSFRAKQKGE